MIRRVCKNRVIQEDPEFERKEYTAEEKKMILDHLRAYPEVTAVAGRVYDCVLRENVLIEDCCYTDGTYIWDEQNIYHIEKYNAAVSDEFLEYVLKKQGAAKAQQNLRKVGSR